MGNKLRDLLSNNRNDAEKIVISFEDELSRALFERALKESQEDGRIKEVGGVKSVGRVLTDGESKYVLESGDVLDSKLLVSPIPLHFQLSSRCFFGERTVDVSFFNLKNDEIRIFSDTSAVQYSITLIKKPMKAEFSYHIDTQKAHTIRDLLDSYLDAYTVFNEVIFKANETAQVNTLKKSLTIAIHFYYRLLRVDEILNTGIKPSEIVGDTGSVPVVDALYFLIDKKIAIRRNTKVLNVTRANTSNGEDLPQPGTKLVAWFTNETTYTFFHREIKLTNLIVVFNMITQKAEFDGDGNQVIHFVDEDDKPMYNAITGFIKPDEAEAESGLIMEKIHLYEKARTLTELVEEDNLSGEVV